MSEEKGALIIVDVQVDFCPGGATPAPRGDEVVPVFNRYISIFREKGFPVYACGEQHPMDSCQFEINDGPWPVHCVQGSEGAKFHPDLAVPPDAVVISKGMNAAVEDSYSAFTAFEADGTDFLTSLQNRGVRHLYVGGLCTDWCVRGTILDGLRNGFQATLLLDATRGLDLKVGDRDRAIDEMIRAGAKTATLGTIFT